MDFFRLKDRVEEWLRYSQPNWFQKRLLGLYTDSFDVDFTARRLAAEDSVRYAQDNMRGATMFHVDYDMHHWMATQVDSDLLDKGLVLEFGVATGRTLNHFARLWPNKTVYGFDGFEGLPEDWTWQMKAGTFKQALPKVRDNCELVVGWFDDTLPGFVKKHTDPVAFLHIDSDLYSSAKTILDCLSKQIVPGTVVLFDEYFNFPGWQQDEYKAWQEFVKKHKVKYEYLGFVSTHQKVAVRVLEIKS